MVLIALPFGFLELDVQPSGARSYSYPSTIQLPSYLSRFNAVFRPGGCVSVRGVLRLGIDAVNCIGKLLPLLGKLKPVRLLVRGASLN